MLNAIKKIPQQQIPLQVWQWRQGREEGEGAEEGHELLSAQGSTQLWKGSRELARTVVGLSPVTNEKMRGYLAKEVKE